MKKQINILLSTGAALAMVLNVAIAYADAGYIDPTSYGGHGSTPHTHTFKKGTKFYKVKPGTKPGKPGGAKPADCKGKEITKDKHGDATFTTNPDGSITCVIKGKDVDSGFIWEN